MAERLREMLDRIETICRHVSKTYSAEMVAETCFIHVHCADCGKYLGTAA